MRRLPEWRGKTDDTAPPARVRVRVFDAYGGICRCRQDCCVVIRPPMKWQCDHVVALVNGGQNIESNLVPILTDHHKVKTARDVAIKSKTYRIRTKHNGVRTKPKGRPLPGTRASGIRKRMNGNVERWS